MTGTRDMPALRPTVLAGMLKSTAILALLWWFIARGQTDAWLVGLPAVAAAAMATVYLRGQAFAGLRLAGLPGFIALFVRESVRGGMDVARRTLAPRLRVRPGFRHYRPRLTDPAARILLVNCISLLPGTLVARLDDDRMELHLLDATEDPTPGLYRLERAIAALFGMPLEATDV